MFTILLKPLHKVLALGIGLFAIGLSIYLWHYKPINGLTKEVKRSEILIETLERNISNQIILHSIEVTEVHGNVSKEEHLKDLKEFENEKSITSSINTDVGYHSTRM